MLFFISQVTLNEWFVLSEYFSISSFKNAFSLGRKQEATLTKTNIEYMKNFSRENTMALNLQGTETYIPNGV